MMEKHEKALKRIEEKLKKIDFNESFSDGCYRRRHLLHSINDAENYASPEFAVYYFEEAKMCYIYEQFVACILMCHLVCSEMLKSYYRPIPGSIDMVNRFGFKELIDKARSDKIISEDISKKLHEMRKFRNLLEHTKDYTFDEMVLLGARIRFESDDVALEYLKLAIILKKSLSWPLS